MHPQLKQFFEESFHYEPTRYFVSPGRLEIIGNHTDHNHGLALVAGASLTIEALVAPREDGVICFNSFGHGEYNIKVQLSEPYEKDYGKPYALLKGIVSCYIDRGYKVGGFDAAIISNVLTGSGVSSSAAIELLFCEILNGLYNEDKISKLEMAQISQIAESVYFHKPCGLLDQIGSAFGGINFVDFNDINHPKIENTAFPFDCHIVLINSGGSHAGLTSFYKKITDDMRKGASLFNKNFLREIPFKDFMSYNQKNPFALDTEEYSRCLHFYLENHRVEDAFKAIKEGNQSLFAKAIDYSGLSSSFILKNTSIPNEYVECPERALALARKVAPHSSHRIHGGGFKGTTIHFVSDVDYPYFIKAMQAAFGKNAVIEVGINPRGAHEEKI